MRGISEIATAMRMAGYEVQDFAKEIKREPYLISKVLNGRVRNKYIEKEIIKRGFGYLLSKVQKETGIFKQEKFDNLQAEVKAEENGRKKRV